MFLVLIFTALVVFFTYKWRRRPHNFPPGPTGLPFIGAIRTLPHLACQQFTKEYGPTIGLKFGGWAVVLHDAKTIKETFSDPAVSGRRANEVTEFLIGDKFGVVQSDGEMWSDQRKFAVRTLRDFGFGKATMEQLILEEGQELVDWLKKQDGAPVELKRRFSLAVANSIWRIMTGHRYEHDDPTLHRILENADRSSVEIFENGTPFKRMVLFMLPGIAKFFGNYFGWTRLAKAAEARIEMFEKIIQEHSESIVPGNPRDFIDVYLEEIKKPGNRGVNFHPSLGTHSLRSVISDFFLAGTDTTSVTLLWTVLYLLHYPEVMDKIQKELATVSGGSRTVTLQDRKRSPYLESVIMEVMRCQTIIPMGLAHSALEDTRIDGFDVPKGTAVHANVHYVHNDPRVWGDPEAFRPERFLNPDGTCMGRHEALLPFSVGRRACMGETLARDTMFIFLALMALNFNVELPKGVTEKPALTAAVRQLTMQPRPFKVSMKYRH